MRIDAPPRPSYIRVTTLVRLCITMVLVIYVWREVPPTTAAVITLLTLCNEMSAYFVSRLQWEMQVLTGILTALKADYELALREAADQAPKGPGPRRAA